jgi:hypothetical protein
MSTLLMHLPEKAPKEAEREYESLEALSQRWNGRVGGVLFATWLLLLPLLFLMGIRDMKPVYLFTFLVVMAVASLAYKTRQKSTKTSTMIVPLMLTVAAVSSLSMMWSPFLFVPAFLVGNIAFFSILAPQGLQRGLLVTSGWLVMIMPMVLEWFGVLAPSIKVVHDQIIILPRAINFPPTKTIAFLIGGGIWACISATVFIARSRDTSRSAEKKLFMHLWQLRQMVPKQLHNATTLRRPHDEQTRG